MNPFLEEFFIVIRKMLSVLFHAISLLVGLLIKILRQFVLSNPKVFLKFFLKALFRLFLFLL